jgi:hypothetical protein
MPYFCVAARFAYGLAGFADVVSEPGLVARDLTPPALS